MSRFVLLIGPPGAGKSTIIKLAKQRGLNAVDLEDFGRGASGHESRKQAAEKLIVAAKDEDSIIVGMADIDPIIFPSDSIRIMLLPSFETYKRRPQERDARSPHKSGQEGLERKYREFVDWAKQFEHVIQNDSTPEDALKEILVAKL